MADDNLLELARKRTPRPGTWGRRGSAGTRYVRTPEGAEKYGLPIGSPITADAIKRAQTRGRSYSVPEDSGDFGSTPPAAGRTRRNASELVSAIRNAPAPRRTNPEGPKKVAVGNSGFGFPEGSRTFRPKDHENFAIVRTPDYQLVVVTDKGIAFELDGDLERELNEELDDDASLNFNVDEPRELDGDVDGDGRTWESSAADGATPEAGRPSRVEDMPGFLTEDRIQEIMDGMEQAGLDQQTRDTAELQLHRSNNRIRAEFEAGQRDESGEPDVPESGDETEDQAVNRLVDDIDREARDAVDRGFAEPEGERSAERSAATSEPSAERTSRRERPSRTATPSTRQQEAAPTREERSTPAAEAEDPEEQLRSLEELAQSRSSGVAEGAVGGADLSVRRNRVNGDMEYFSGNESLASRNEALVRGRSTERAPRDTSDLSVGELTDEELTALQEDLNDFLETRDFPPRRVLRRSRDVEAEIARRQGGEEGREGEAENVTPEAPTAPENVPSGSPRDGSYDELADPEDIPDARPGDSFVVRHESSGVDRTFVVGEDGRVYPNTGGFGIDREGFRDWLMSDDYELWSNRSNRDNRASRPSAEPGDPASSTWAREADAGAVAYSPDGVVAERNEDGSWETPLGRVNDEFFDAGDIEGDAPEAIVRTEPDVDNRPVGATNELTDPADLDEVRTGDAITFVGEDGRELAHATRRSDDTLRVELEDGLHFDVPLDDGILNGETVRPWHVPNQDQVGEPSQESWSVGDRIRSTDDLHSLQPGTVVRVQGDDRRPEGYDYIIEPDGQVRATNWPEGSTAGVALLNDSVTTGRLSVAEIPDRDLTPNELEDRREALVPRVVENLEDYETGDTISDYRHVRDMKAGDQVTMVVPASRNGGREMHVVMTRTDDENTLGGYMFLVGNGGRGYNSFGENNQNLYQAIADGRLLFGNVAQLDGTDRERIEGDWSTAKDIELWEGGPKVSEADLRQYIASQMSSMAMQKSYFDPSLLPDSNPFRSQELRRTFAKKAKEKYDTPGNPMRSKPASIRYASELLGVEFSDPGSALVADNLTPEDFRRRVTIGRWLRGTEAPAEANMGPEQIEVTAADIKTALAVIDNMLETDAQGDPDKILKRVFARQGSPLQNMNTSAAVAAYFGVERYRMREDGTWQKMTTIGKQYDKRRNKELFRQMLLEQLEGREPGYYGLPEDEQYEKNGKRYLNRTKFSRPEVNSANDGTQPPAPAPEPEAPDTEAPLTTQDILDLNDGDTFVGTLDGIDYEFRVNGDRYEDTQYGTGYRRTDVGLRNMLSNDWTFRRGDASQAEPEITPEITPNSAETLDDLNQAFQRGEISLREFRARERAANLASVSENEPETPSGTELLENEDLGQLSGGDRVVAIATDGTEITMQRSGARLVTNDGRQVDLTDTSRFYGISRYRDQGWTFRRATDEEISADTPSTDAPEAPTTSRFNVGDELGAADIAELGTGSQIEYTRRTDGRVSTYTRDADGTWRTASGTEVEPGTWSRARFTVRETGQASASEPEAAPETGELTTDASVIANLPEGTRVTFTTATGDVHETTATTNSYGNPILQIDGGGGMHRSEATVRELLSSGGTFRVHESGDAGPQPGSTFQGADIENIPVGSHIRGASGREYDVTDTGIRSTDGSVEYGRSGVQNLNAQFTYLGSSRAGADVQSDSRVGTWVAATDMRDLPDGSYFRARSGLVWQRRGNRIRSTRSNQARYVRNLTGEYQYLGENVDASSIPQRVARPSAPTQTLEEAGLSRVSRETIERYDQPRPVPEVEFNRQNDTPWREYMNTDEGRQELRNVIASALPEGSSVSVHGNGESFTASYSTPDGGHGEMTRTMRGDRRIENAVARASGAHFAAVQDNLFEFYRHHGIEEVEVHGLSGQNWNGAHTWIRRGFRPDPDRAELNYSTLRGLQSQLDGVISRIAAGREARWNEFLDEARDLSRRMTELLNSRNNSSLDENMEKLYQIWRDLTYLGEVQDAQGRTARGNRQSIGWYLLGNRARQSWYYGVRNLDDYFQD